MPRRWRRRAGRAVAQQIRDAAGDGRRRIEPIDRPGRIRLEALGQQRVMRAGQHHRVGAPPSASTKQAAISALIAASATGCAGEFGLGKGRKMRRADQVDVAAGGEFADQGAGIFAGDGRLRAQHRDALASSIARRPA